MESFRTVLSLEEVITIAEIFRFNPLPRPPLGPRGRGSTSNDLRRIKPSTPEFVRLSRHGSSLSDMIMQHFISCWSTQVAVNEAIQHLFVLIIVIRSNRRLQLHYSRDLFV